MCIAIYKPKDKNINRKTLKRCWDANDDGAGFMYAHCGKLEVSKGFFSFRSFYGAYRAAQGANNENFVLHFRIATSGTADKEMCHPFTINENLAFVHNGIFTGKGTKSKSDTAIFCEKTLKAMPAGFLRTTGCINLLREYCKAEISKLVFLDNFGFATIINEAAGTWDKGVWFSNTTYKISCHAGYADAAYYQGLYHDDKFAGDGPKSSYEEICDYCGASCLSSKIVNMSGGYRVCRECSPFIYK